MLPGFTLHKLDTARHCAAVLSACHSALPQGNIPSMKVAVVKERRAFEHRVAASPDTVKRMIGMGLEVVVESGAGEGAWFSDAAFAEAGASIATDEATALRDADIVLKVQRPLIGGEGGIDELALFKRDRQTGVAKLAVTAYRQSTGALAGSSGPSFGSSNHTETVILLVIDNIMSDIEPRELQSRTH